MKHNKLAILGGDPIRREPFPAYNVIGEEECQAVQDVMKTGVLSRFLGTWHNDFYGGPQVQAFEEEWSQAIGCQHSITVNSATSGLYAAMGAAGVGLGDEVIVSPYTMSASATAPLIYNATPVFADIDPKTCCLSAQTIKPKLSPKTKAIIVVHIFGGAADMEPIMELARAHNLVVIEDCAQSPLGTYKGKKVGTIGDMGVFSLNYHKHIHTGEGGIVTTNNPVLAEKVQLIRNHAEAVVEGKGVDDLTNMVGFNYRLGEIECAMGRSLLRKLPALLAQRCENVAFLEKRLAGLPGLEMPSLAAGGSHCHYVHALSYNAQITGIKRERVVEAIRAELAPCKMREHEGVLLFQGYVKPLYWQPLYQKRAHLALQNETDYSRGMCPVVEDAHLNRMITHELMRPGMSEADLNDVANAFEKVFSQLDRLRT
ncbi:MAG: DegT/DnrJ/EryC1/StrS family aminotransferase [Terasakiella sp.]|uniref:DegT/DnrJ/EryC1/StrS family aminotransferase n=1 Tax=unclassified Terasakiella TaxID=2614952 RepID=UPI003AFFDD9E